MKPYAEFTNEEGLVGQKYQDFLQVRSKLSELFQKKVGNEKIVSKDPIKLTIHSQYNPDVTLIDLPGLDEDVKNSSDVTFNYIKDESSIILYVQNVNCENFTKIFEPSSKNNYVLQNIKNVDKEFTRTIGIFTKVDLLQPNSNNENFILLKKILLSYDNNEILKHPFIVLKNRGASDNSSIEDHLLKERGYFTTHNVFRSMTIPEQITLESLVDKIKKLIYSDPNVKKNLVTMHKILKEKTGECQKELLKFGTDYIGYTNDTKNTYATSLINNFCELIEKTFSGKMSDTSENLTSHRLKEIYVDFLKQYKTGYNPSSNIKNEEIIRIIKMTEGDTLSGFPESEVIYNLLEDDMENLRGQVKNYVDTISDITRESVKEIMVRVFCRFPKLLDRIEELMNGFIDENFEKATFLINSLAEMNFNYLYIDEKSLSYNELLKKFVLSDDEAIPARTRERGSTISNSSQNNERLEKMRISHEERDRDHYYNGLAEYVKILINHFFSLMVRNLREAIPKITGHYYINSLKHNVRFYILTEITKEFSYENFLEEDPEVAKNRNYYLNLMKVLKNCDKILQYDEEGDTKKDINQIIEKNIQNFNKMQLESQSKKELKSINTSPEKINENSYSATHNRRISGNIPENTNKRASNLNNTNTNLSSNLTGDSKQSEGGLYRTQTSKESYSSNINKTNNTSTSTSNNSYQSVNTQSTPKYSIQNLLKDEEKKPVVNSSNKSLSEQINNSKKTEEKPKEAKEGISIKMDPNSNDIKDMKINVDMDADTAYKFYQTNKKYLPTGQQMLAGAKATANFVEKNSNVITGNEEEDSNKEKENLVTGNKVQQKKAMFDPLTSLFGLGAKKDTKPSTSSSSQAATDKKKGQF